MLPAGFLRDDDQMTAMRNITVLGATGSVGRNTLDVVARHPQRFRVVALTACSHWQTLFEACQRFRPEYAVMTQPAAAQALQREVRAAGLPCEVLSGADALDEVAALPQVDTVMAAIVGIAGLKSTLAAARAGKRVLLANKEALVTAGHLFIEAVRGSGARLLPIDSEHSAIFQALPRDYNGDADAAGVRRIILTASGGPFRTLRREALGQVTPEQACHHPNWVMGRKISVDSATMMNKGLEVIEAHWLFGVERDRIHVVIHPESVIHSLVEYVDGSVMAQLGNPDMRTPIAVGLGFPDRIAAGIDFLNLAKVGAMHFEEPDVERFPCLGLGYRALAAGGNAPAALNAANEVAVEHFLAGRLPFVRIAALIEAVLSRLEVRPLTVLDDVLATDRWARKQALALLAAADGGRAASAA
jgi:1-deoxy-D-xylulose-5-phosphate reductoisomerase